MAVARVGLNRLPVTRMMPCTFPILAIHASAKLSGALFQASEAIVRFPFAYFRGSQTYLSYDYI